MNDSRVFLALSLAYLVLWSLVSADNQPSKTNNAKDEAAKKLFDPDPAHPWNRLHQHFFVRALPEGGSYVHHGIDAPPLGTDGSYLLEGDTYEKTIRLLDDFLKAKDDERIKDSVKRALLQRDLWYVFETLDKSTPFTEPNPFRDSKDTKQAERREVEKRLAKLMRRLEQSPDQLRKLPDNYAMTVKNKTFPAAFDAEHPERPYLPTDLLDGPSDWIPISRHYDDGPGLAAPHHQMFTQGRAVFIALLRLPGGRKETEEYLLRMPAKTEHHIEKFPPLPAGSQVAFVRRMLLPDDHGNLQSTPITEKVQLRVFPKKDEQRFFEFTIDRGDLLSGRYDLRPVGATETRYFGFGIMCGSEPDLFTKGSKREPVVVMSNCVNCHAIPSQFSINTFGFSELRWYSGAVPTDFATQVRETVKRKTHSYSWGFLQGLREVISP